MFWLAVVFGKMLALEETVVESRNQSSALEIGVRIGMDDVASLKNEITNINAGVVGKGARRSCYGG